MYSSKFYTDSLYYLDHLDPDFSTDPNKKYYKDLALDTVKMETDNIIYFELSKVIPEINAQPSNKPSTSTSEIKNKVITKKSKNKKFKQVHFSKVCWLCYEPCPSFVCKEQHIEITQQCLGEIGMFAKKARMNMQLSQGDLGNACNIASFSIQNFEKASFYNLNKIETIWNYLKAQNKEMPVLESIINKYNIINLSL